MNHMPWIAFCEYTLPDCGQMPVAGRRKHPTMFALHMSRLQRALAVALPYLSLSACYWSIKGDTKRVNLGALAQEKGTLLHPTFGALQ